MKTFTFRIGGVHPDENKITAEVATKVAALPKQAIIPLSQHIGAPAKAVVKKGDKVKINQPLGLIRPDASGNYTMQFQLRKDTQSLNPEQWVAF